MALVARTIFCDDIRTEASGKYILIGVYPGHLLMASEAPFVVLSTYIEIAGLSRGAHRVQLQVKFDNYSTREIVANGDFHLEMHQPELPGILYPTGLQFPVNSDGTLILEMLVDEREHIEAGRLIISKNSEGAPDAPVFPPLPKPAESA